MRFCSRVSGPGAMESELACSGGEDYGGRPQQRVVSSKKSKLVEKMGGETIILDNAPKERVMRVNKTSSRGKGEGVSGDEDGNARSVYKKSSEGLTTRFLRALGVKRSEKKNAPGKGQHKKRSMSLGVIECDFSHCRGGMQRSSTAMTLASMDDDCGIRASMLSLQTVDSNSSGSEGILGGRNGNEDEGGRFDENNRQVGRLRFSRYMDRDGGDEENHDTNEEYSADRSTIIYKGSKFVINFAGVYMKLTLKSMMKLRLDRHFPKEWNSLYATTVWLLLSYAKQRNYDLSSRELLLKERLFLASMLDEPAQNGYKCKKMVYNGVECDLIRSKSVKKGKDSFHNYDVLLYLHGGTFVSMSAKSFRPLVSTIMKKSKRIMSAITVNYRLCPEHPYPAAPNDVYEVYKYLIEDMKFHPSQIIVGGDSTGGNLVGSLLLRLKKEGKEQPMCALLLSSWVDLDYESQVERGVNGQVKVIKPYTARSEDGVKEESCCTGAKDYRCDRHQSVIMRDLAVAEREKLLQIAKEEGEEVTEEFLENEEEERRASIFSAFEYVSKDQEGRTVDVLAALHEKEKAAKPQQKAPNKFPSIIVHPGDVIKYKRASLNVNFGKDIVDPRFDRLCAEAYIDGSNPRDPLISPFYGDLEGLCPCLIHCGALEVTMDEQLEFGDKLKAAGVTTQVKVFDNEVHDFQSFPGSIHAKESFKLMSSFIEEVRKDQAQRFVVSDGALYKIGEH
eukprot:Nk52_evm30s2402 gene=Nk52_evmTU30s2402